ncbi:11956_t:CDS:1, partial [Acaulospora morrowiae]
IHFTFNGRGIEAWSVRHENEEEHIGLYVIVQKYLKNKRCEIKLKMEKF